MTTTPWYNYPEKERISEVYAKYTIKDFYDWWCGGENKFMEVRIKDFQLIRKVAQELNLPWSASGVYVNNADTLKQVIQKTRAVTTWFGINSRKRNWDMKGRKNFGGRDANVYEIDVLFIDIDRIKKEGPATSLDLENCDKLSNLILERLATQGWNKNYIKICSGNGVQLLIKLDFPIKLPEQEYDMESKSFIVTEKFDKLRQLIPKGIGQDLLRFCRKYQDELGVEVDKTCFNIGRVAALPFTKNYKYNGFTWRGIIEIQNGKNDGFSDYILLKEDDIKVYEQKNVFSSKALTAENRIKPGNLHKNVLIKFMLENDLPAGMRNNYLWFQVKCLLRDSGIDLASEEFRKIHKQLEQKYGALPANIPEKRFGFDENIVNKYCIVNCITPIYSLWPKRSKIINCQINNVKWEDKDLVKDEYSLDSTTDILGDLDWFKKQLQVWDSRNAEYSYDSPMNAQKFAKFIRACIVKYGEEKTKYYFTHIMKHYLSHE